MNHKLNSIILDFQGKVEKACSLLREHLQTDEPHIYKPDVGQYGVLGDKYKYFYHGAGCRVHLTEDEVIDFDFGVNGRIDGFDQWRLKSFVDDRTDQYPDISSENIKDWLEDAESLGKINISEKDSCGSLYFFT